MAVSVVTPTKKKNEYEKGSEAKKHFGTDDYAFLQTQARIYGMTDYDGSEQKDKLLINLDKTSKDNTTGYKAPPGGKGIVQGALSGNSNNPKPKDTAGKGAIPVSSPNSPTSANPTTNPSNSNTTSAIVADATNFLMQQANALRGNTRYSRQADTALSRVLNREKFSYDMNADPLFQQALSSAMNNGQMAMRNTMAQASALTGGYGSSYATTAGNQAYNDFIQDAYDNLPQYYNMALQAYQMETDNLLNEYALLSEADNQAYQRALDSYDITYKMRNRLYDEAYQLGRDEVNDTRYNTEWEYQLGRDTINDTRYDTEWGYQLGRDTINDTRYDTEWGYQLGRDTINDTRYENEWNWQKEQDTADNYYRQQAFNHEVEQDKFNNQLNGDKDGDGSNKLSNGASVTSMVTYKQKALEAYNKGGDSAVDTYVESLGLNDDEKAEIGAYVYGDGTETNKGNGELPLSMRTFTKIEDTFNWLWGNDGDDVVQDQYGKKWELDELEEALEADGVEDKVIEEILDKLTDTGKGKSYTYSKK